MKLLLALLIVPALSATEPLRRASDFCGGIAGIECPDGYVCIDNPDDACSPENGGADCGGLCQPCCAGIADCPKDHDCVDIPNGGRDPDCFGYCSYDATGDFCGGIAGFPCPPGYLCMDDPKDNCDPKSGGADCGGICRARCFFTKGFECPQGSVCMDIAGDGCDPNRGDPDCSGYCITAEELCDATPSCGKNKVPVCLTSGETKCLGRKVVAKHLSQGSSNVRNSFSRCGCCAKEENPPSYCLSD